MTRPKAVCLSILGTGSDVGKSIVATALCRIFRQRGYRVAPFKAQNMSNNSYITREGGEMGRAQVVQAEAAGVEPHVDMNPVLLKPNTDIGSQVVVHGKVIGNRNAKDYYKSTEALFQKSLESLERLRDNYDLIIMEGAGSCGEVNLRSRDFVNFKIANAVGAPVILVGDINRGGVFAQIIGTLAVIPPEDKSAVKGVIINRFRGHAELFQDGIQYIEEQTQLPVYGLVHQFENIEIDSEDGVPLDAVTDPKEPLTKDRINIAVLRLPHISNYTDFAPLEKESNVTLHYLKRIRDLYDYDLVIIPGSKNTRSDLQWLKDTGWAAQLVEYARDGGHLGGICGGYQILGTRIHDPLGVEGEVGESIGLGLLEIETTLEERKTLSRSKGIFLENQEQVEGYEIHMGITRGQRNFQPLIQVQSQNEESKNHFDGVRSYDGKIWGTYFHGLFDSPGLRRKLLNKVQPNILPSDATQSTENWGCKHIPSRIRGT